MATTRAPSPMYQARALGEQVRGAVNRDRSGAADVDDPTLAVLEEEVAADLREGLQGEGLGDGADTHEHDAVVVGVERLDLVVHEQVLDQVAAGGALRCPSRVRALGSWRNAVP